jgi:hypothetical protein
MLRRTTYTVAVVLGARVSARADTNALASVWRRLPSYRSPSSATMCTATWLA